MKKLILGFAAAGLYAAVSSVSAQSEYVTIEMEVDVNAPVRLVWEKIGDYCAISEWLDVDCEITSGDGGIGTVRSLAGGRITEVLVAQTDRSYGYAQPAPESGFYNFYHGNLEARYVNQAAAQLVYTLMYDVSNLPDQAAKDADIAQRRQMFEAALASMKALVEG